MISSNEKRPFKYASFHDGAGGGTRTHMTEVAGF